MPLMQSQSWLTNQTWPLSFKNKQKKPQKQTNKNIYLFIYVLLPERPRLPCAQTHARTHGRFDSTWYPPLLLVHLVAPLPITAGDPDAPSLPYKVFLVIWPPMAGCKVRSSPSSRDGSFTFGHGVLPLGRLHSPANELRRGAQGAENLGQRAGSVSASTAAATASHCIQLRLLRPVRSLLARAGIVIEGGVGGGASGAVAAEQRGSRHRISRRYYCRRPSTWVTASFSLSPSPPLSISRSTTSFSS